MRTRRAFSLIELIVVMGIVSIGAAVVTINLAGGQRRTVRAATVDTLVADVRSAQMQAMTGASGRQPFGLYWDDRRYVVFKGNSYNSQDPANYSVQMDNGIRLSSTFSGSQVVFSPISGEVVGFVPLANTVTVTDAEDASYVILTVNRYGVVEEKN